MESGGGDQPDEAACRGTSRKTDGVAFRLQIEYDGVCQFRRERRIAVSFMKRQNLGEPRRMSGFRTEPDMSPQVDEVKVFETFGGDLPAAINCR
ncbi:hypothetical protein J31TS4_46880 [Paenibacillus sp. J31TS4]|nr:hypothetical protein J31TS4_46880 [Paenibacillus sp. J31TS4]